MLHKTIVYKLPVLLVFLIFLASCTTGHTSEFSFDPSKKYAVFLVVNSTHSSSILQNARQKSIEDGFEVGPAVYYNPSTKDFSPSVKKLTANKAVALLWVVGGLMDAASVQKTASQSGYSGAIRFMPVPTASQEEN